MSVGREPAAAGGDERAAALELQLRAFRDFIGLLARTSEGAFAIDRDGFEAAVVPAVPQRSVTNSVAYRDGRALLGQLDELAETYERAGIAAWTVWCPEFDRETIAALERAGHRFDGRPAAMVLDLATASLPDPGDLAWDDSATLGTLGRLNDAAYGHPPDEGFGAAFRHWPDGIDLRLYQARSDGEVACVLGTIDHAPGPSAAGPDCGIYFVATAEAHRGRGLAVRLLGVALAVARERGCVTSSLQATSMGQPVYERLGYRTAFRFHMYERRRD